MRPQMMFATLAAVFITLSHSAFAQTDDMWRAGARVNVTASGHHDVWVAGAIVSVRGEVNNDLWVAGAEVEVNATVKHDAWIAGAIATVTGSMANDLNVAGARVSVDAQVGGALSVAGTRVLIGSRTDVTGKAKLAGADVVLAGAIKGPAEIYADSAQVDGRVAGDLRVRARSVTVGKTAVIDGNAVFETFGEPVIEEGATIRGRQTVTLPKPPAAPSTGTIVKGLLGVALFAIGAGFVLGLILLIGGRAFVERTIDQIRVAPLRNALVGFAVLILLPIVAIVVMVTVIGIPVGLLTLLAFPLLLLTASVIAAFGLADWVFNRSRAERSFGMRLLLLIGGLVILALIGLIPVLGFLTWFLAVIIGLGAIWHAARRAPPVEMTP